MKRVEIELEPVHGWLGKRLIIEDDKLHKGNLWIATPTRTWVGIANSPDGMGWGTESGLSLKPDQILQLIELLKEA